jgi:cell division protein FtsB
MRGLLDRGNGKFAVAKRRRQEEAKERQARFDEMTNTPEKIERYVNDLDTNVGRKVVRKLAARATKMVNHRKKNTN